MKRRCLLLPLLFLLITPIAWGQVTGKWKMIDDRDGREKAVFEIFEHDDRYHGRVVELLRYATDTHCKKCSGELKNQPIVGMTIIWDLEKTPNGGEDGKVLDPASGKTYSCLIELVEPDKLKLRGYLGLPLFGRTQYWSRLE